MCFNPIKPLGKLASATGGLLGGGLGIASSLLSKKKDKPPMSPPTYGG